MMEDRKTDSVFVVILCNLPNQQKVKITSFKKVESYI